MDVTSGEEVQERGERTVGSALVSDFKRCKKVWLHFHIGENTINYIRNKLISREGKGRGKGKWKQQN